MSVFDIATEKCMRKGVDSHEAELAKELRLDEDHTGELIRNGFTQFVGEFERLCEASRKGFVFEAQDNDSVIYSFLRGDGAATIYFTDEGEVSKFFGF